MKLFLKLPKELRKELKKPLGKLIEVIPEKSMVEIAGLVNKSRPVRIISVGDVITQYMLMSGILPDLSIVDHKIYRRKIEFPFNYEGFYNIIVYVKNPPGHISEDAWNKIRKYLTTNLKTLIVVDGEEDLLTLPAIVEAPEGSLIFYGQPSIGVVSITVSNSIKGKVRNILKKFIKLKHLGQNISRTYK